MLKFWMELSWKHSEQESLKADKGSLNGLLDFPAERVN